MSYLLTLNEQMAEPVSQRGQPLTQSMCVTCHKGIRHHLF